MNNELVSIVLLLQKINAQISKPVFSKDTITEELENAADAQENSTEINTLLRTLLDTDIKNAEHVDDHLFLLHLKLLDAIWHIDQVHVMVKDLIVKYRDSL